MNSLDRVFQKVYTSEDKPREIWKARNRFPEPANSSKENSGAEGGKGGTMKIEVFSNFPFCRYDLYKVSLCISYLFYFE